MNDPETLPIMTTVPPAARNAGWKACSRLNGPVRFAPTTWSHAFVA